MIIDFRLRPPYEGYLDSQTYSVRTISWVNRLMCTATPEGPEAAIQGSMELMLREMDDAGIDIGVVPGRYRPGTEIANEVLKRLLEEHHGRFVALGSVNVLDA